MVSKLNATATTPSSSHSRCRAPTAALIQPMSSPYPPLTGIPPGGTVVLVIHPHEYQRRGGSYAQASRCVCRDLAVSSPVWSNSSGTVVPQPVLELEQVLGVSAAFASGTRVATPGSLGRVSVNLPRAGPSLRDRQDNRRAARPLLLATLAGCQAGSCDPADRCCSVAAAKS